MSRRSTAQRRNWALFVLTLAAFSSLARAATTPPPTAKDPSVESLEPRTAADEQMLWGTTLRVTNSTENGLYVDSARCVIEDLDPGVTGNPKKYSVTLPGFSIIMPSLSAGQAGDARYQFPATADRARLTYHIHTHSAAGKHWELTTVVEADPGELSKRLPSAMIDAGGHKVETVFMPALAESGKKMPGILLVHGSGSHARTMLRLGDYLANRGFHVMLVSQPGFGTSDGPADFAGPATVSALSAALDRLERSPGVDTLRIGVWGIDRGATAASLLAAKRPEVRAVIAQSGIFDLWSTYRGTNLPALREAIVREAGRDSNAWRARSPIAGESHLHGAVMILHGELDAQIPAVQAQSYQATLERGGTTVESQILKRTGHSIPQGTMQKTTLGFLHRYLGS
jgi:pimeloyl-ACP methyl ester carboxylesterase